jgi:hypothetical protein
MKIHNHHQAKDHKDQLEQVFNQGLLPDQEFKVIL